MQYRRTCNKCNGRGYLNKRPSLTGWIRETCDVCNGNGYVELSNVAIAPIVTTLEGRPDDVLKHAIGELDKVVLVGYTKDGEEYYASSVADGPNALWLMQRGVHRLLNIVDAVDE